MTILELVRHGDSVNRSGWWNRPDRDRPLSDKGHQQARRLATALTGLGAEGAVAAVLSSPYLRCIQTVAPLAESLGLPVTTEEGLAEAPATPDTDGPWTTSAWLAGRALKVVGRMVAAHPDGRVVACSHGDVVPALMALLAGRDELQVANARLRKGARFTLTFEGSRCTGATAWPVPGEEAPRT